MKFTDSDIYTLAQRSGVLDFQELLKNRSEKGFQHFILDLLKEPEVKGQGWSLKGGLLNVRPDHNTDEIMNFLESKLGHHPWFQTRADRQQMLDQGVMIESPQLPAGFTAYTAQFKSLGSWGKNLAMDVVTLLRNNDGSISVQVIVRPFDKKYAFVGGMVDKNKEKQSGAILEKCYEEFIEEYYSKDLFAVSSETLRRAGDIDPNRLNEVLEHILQIKEFAPLLEFNGELKATFLSGSSFASKITQLEKTIKGKHATLRSEDLDHLWVRVKFQLYKNLFPNQYKKLTDFLHDNLHARPETTNESDPRNTQLGFMATVPHYFYVDKSVLQAKEKEWLVKPKGGDDALSAKVVRLEDLYTKSMYSAHGRILLECLAHLAQCNPSVLMSDAVQAQFAKVNENLLAREADQLSLVGGSDLSSSAVLQRTPAGSKCLPVASDTAQLEQLSIAVQTLNPDSEAVVTVPSIEEANGILLDTLGDIRYARLEDKLDIMELPVSFRTVLAVYAQCAEVNCLIDNSGSMTRNQRVTDDFGQQYDSTRWQVAKDRFTNLMPLLALAGVKVNVRFLNYHHSITTNRDGSDIVPFDFSVKRSPSGDVDESDLQALESELLRAIDWLEQVFSVAPYGGTHMKDRLGAMFANHSDDECRINLIFTDGDPTDRSETVSSIQTRANPGKSPVNVISCTDDTDKIGWVRDLGMRDGSFITVVGDHQEELTKLHHAQGFDTPIYFGRNIWLGFQITPVVDPVNMEQGFFLYSKAIQAKDKLSKEHLSELVGYDLPQGMYDHYLMCRAQVSQVCHGSLFQPAMSRAASGLPQGTAYPSAPYYGGR